MKHGRQSLAGFSRGELPSVFGVTYGNALLQVEMAQGKDSISIGHILLTDAGQRLASLTDIKVVPGFLEYAIEKWSVQGVKVSKFGELVKIPDS